MPYDLKTDVPEAYLDNADTEGYIEILQDGLDNMRADIASLLTSHDLEKADEEFLDLMLYEIGWDVPITLTVTQKRKVVRDARDLYKGKGLFSAMIDVVDRLLGFTITIDGATTDAAILEVTWQIPFHRLMGLEALFQFVVHAPTTITAQQEADLGAIIDFMKWGPSFYTIVKDL